MPLTSPRFNLLGDVEDTKRMAEVRNVCIVRVTCIVSVSVCRWMGGCTLV